MYIHIHAYVYPATLVTLRWIGCCPRSTAAPYLVSVAHEAAARALGSLCISNRKLLLVYEYPS